MKKPSQNMNYEITNYEITRLRIARFLPKILKGLFNLVIRNLVI
jgi:hypothetical protein